MTDATPTTPNRYDIFLSYPSVDRGPATALKSELEALGLQVWMDTERIDDAASIQHSIEAGLAHSRVLVAWYSKSYARSRACQWELTAALVVSSQPAQLATKRVLIVNPEDGMAHIAQTAVRDIELISAASGIAMTSIANKLQVAGAHAQGPMGDIRQLTRPRWHGLKKGLGSNRFVGRVDELWRVQNALTNGRFAIVSGHPSPGAAVGLANVRGSGGVGKSMLAEEYALRFGAFWPGGIFWLDALGVSDRSEEAPDALAQRRASYQREQLGIFAEALGVDSQGLNTKQLHARIGHRLQRSGEPYLWLVDDLPACERAVLDDWLAPSSNGVTLITSRARQHDALGTQVELGILQLADAYALLCREREPHDGTEEAAARSIVQRLGGHAMAVDQARAACAAQGYCGFLERLDLDDQRALALSMELAGELPNGHERDITKTFLSSIDSLTPNGLDLLTLAAQLSNAPISRELIYLCKLTHHLLTVQGFDFDDAGIRRLAEVAAQDWAALSMRELTACSLADHIQNETTSPSIPPVRSIGVHTLIARIAREHFSRDHCKTQSVNAWRYAALVALKEILPIAGKRPEVSVLLNEVPHARHLCENVETLEQAKLLVRLAELDHVRGHYSDALSEWLRVLPVLDDLLGSTHTLTLSSYGNMANSLRATGALSKTRTIQERLLHIQENLLGPDHPETLACMNNLALTVQGMGDLEAARALRERVLDICVRVAGPEDPDTLTCMNNLGESLRVAGNLVGAKAMLEKALAISQRVRPPDHPHTLTTMGNLAEVLRNQGELTTARTLQEESLRLRLRTQGADHPDTWSCLGNLAVILSDMGEYQGALTIEREVLAKREQHLGAEHPETLLSMNNLAQTLRNLNDLPSALALQERTVALSQHVRGPEHPDTVHALGMLLQMLVQANDDDGLQAAARRYQQSFSKLPRSAPTVSKQSSTTGP